MTTDIGYYSTTLGRNGLSFGKNASDRTADTGGMNAEDIRSSKERKYLGLYS